MPAATGDGGRANDHPTSPPHHRPFGPHTIPHAHVFVTTSHSFAFVNLKPVVPGHVLVSPHRVVPRLAGLRSEEVADLFALATRVSCVVEAHYGAGSTTLAVQDGPLAGQTVPHVHVHVLPRRAGDFANNDDVYSELERPDAGPPVATGPPSQPPQPLDPDAPRVARSHEDMAAEAAVLRALF
jgi:diadenosine tetraphosphate (Ap4A) HIT family hydrolase